MTPQTREDLRFWSECGLYLACYIVIILTLSLLLGECAPASAQQDLPPMVDNPHGIARCDLPARAAKNGATPCGCPHYVAKVQEAYADKCWRDSGIPKPPFTMPMAMLPAGVAACMKTMPDHCEAIAWGVFHWRDELGVEIDDTPPAGGMYNRCQTSCYPNKCGCVDGACREHGYYMEEGSRGSN